MAYHISCVHHPDVPPLDSSPTAVAYNARVLNLDEHGNPLTYARALIRGPDADRRVSATATEYHRKLLDTGTIKPIFKKDQPPDRMKDTTYLNNVVAEKWNNPGGSIKQRVRGTAGGIVTRKRYPFKVSGKTADMDTVNKVLCTVAGSRFGSSQDSWYW
jgi:hypothetical protein